MSCVRRGALLLELVVSLALVVALIALATPGIRRIRDLQMANTGRAQTLRACSAALAVLDGMPWEEVTSEAADNQAVTEVVKANLPNGELKLEITSDSSEEKRLTAIVEWSGPAETTRSVRLTAWRYRTPEGQP